MTETEPVEERLEEVDVRRNMTEVVDRLLQCILDPQQYAPYGIAEELKVLSPEDRNNLFSDENGTNTTPDRVKDLLPAACETGDLETVVWLLFYGAEQSAIGRKGSPLEVATLYGQNEIVEKLIDWNQDVLYDKDVVISCLMKACEGRHNDLVKAWLGHLNNIRLLQEPWSHFTRTTENNTVNGFVPRLPKHGIQHLPDHIVQELNQTMPLILEVWVVSNDDEDNEDDDNRLRAMWSNKQLQSFEETWLQRPRYNANLVSIDLSHNALMTLPALLLWGLPWLEYLDLSNNRICDLPDSGQGDAAEQSGLKTLKLTNNNLTVVPTDIFMMPQLELLLLARNKITSIGSEQHDDANDIQPVWRCTNLQELNLSYNALTTIPCSLSTACRMRRLDLANNELTEIPTPWHCPMESLNLSFNQISGFQDIDIFWRHSMKVLNLASNNLVRIPPTICRLAMLKNLNLSDTKIDELPDKEIWKTFSLSQLDLSHNRLTDIDNKHLERSFTASLGLGRRRREREVYKDLEFPEFFNTNLKVLDLSFNDLHQVPKSVNSMRALQSLNIQGNEHISSLPNEMAFLRQLTVLKVDKDRIKEPVTHALKQNILPATEFTETVMEALRDRFLEYESCREIKIALVGPSQSGKTELLSCLTGCDWPYHDSGVNVVRRSSLNFQRRQATEPNIYFTLWDLKGGDDFLVIHQAFLTPRTIYLLVWDIRERDDDSLKKLEPYILNIKARAPSCPIIAVATHVDKYSIQSGLRARVITESSQVFLRMFPEVNVSFVEVDARPRNMDYERLRSSRGTDGITNLKEMIYNCAETLKFVKKTRGGCEEQRLIDREVPRSYIDLKERLSWELTEQQGTGADESMSLTSMILINTIPIMTEADAIRIRNTLGIPIETFEEFEEVVEFLQDCGLLLHIRDYTYRLTHMYFPDPVWLSDTLVKVIRLKNNDATANSGIVGESQLRRLCAESGFGEERFKEYLQLMARFEIALSTSIYSSKSNLREEVQSFVIPSALPRGRPCMEHIGENPYKYKLMRWYRMAYIPPGFWSRLVARLLVSIKQHNSNPFSIELKHVQTYVSQEGMSIHHGHGQIKIEPMRFPGPPNREEPGLRITLLSKDGTFSPLGFIVDHIEKLIKEWYPGLTKNREDGRPSVVRLVPCPACPVCEQSLENKAQYSAGSCQIDNRCHLFSLEELIRAICLSGSECIVCPRHPTCPVSLTSLVPDLMLTDLAVEHLEEEELVIESILLGIGSFGKVYAAKYRGRSVAVKSLLTNHDYEQSPPTTSSSSSSSPYIPHVQPATSTVTSQPASQAADNLQSVIKTFPTLRYEVKMMSKLNHPCVLQVVGVLIPRLALAVELAPLGDLASYVSHEYKQRRKSFVLKRVVHESVLPRALSFKIAFQVASVIDYLHDLGIIHADVKTNNVLLFSTDIQSSINVKLSDYGISHELDIGGVKGDAGRHAFCAPEIAKGLAFDEQIDWFSFAMFLYHIISGTLPFMNTTSLNTIANVTTGSRPDFQYYNYSMRPQLPHMEGIMKTCWRENPDQRPNGKELLAVMKDMSFLCLRRNRLLESDPKAVFYSDVHQTKIDVDAIESSHVYVWHSDGHVVDHDMHTGDNGKVIRVAQQDQGQVLCAFAYDEMHVIGTSNQTIETYNLVKDKLALQSQFTVPSKPTTLFYTCTENGDGIPGQTTSPGLLFVGVYDGEIAIYKNQPTVDTLAPEWTKLKTLTLSVDPAPCLCIEPAKEVNEIWISCGTTLRVLNTSDGLLDPTLISVSSDKNCFVKCLCYSKGNIWCFVEGSYQIVRYDAATRLLMDSFYCGNSLQRPGSSLMKCMSMVEVNAEIASTSSYKSSETEPKKKVVGAEGLEQSQPLSQSAPESYLPRGRGRDGRRTLSESLQFSEEDSQVKVSSIIVVQNTLWIGRDRGDILVINIDNDQHSRYQFGEVLAVLTANPILSLPEGHTSRLLRLGLNRVSEYQIIDHHRGSRQLFRHHLLIWESWSSEEITEARKLAVIPNQESGVSGH